MFLALLHSVMELKGRRVEGASFEWFMKRHRKSIS